MPNETKLPIEVLTPEGWKAATLEVSEAKYEPLGIGFRIEFDGKNIGMALSPMNGAVLAKTLYVFYQKRGIFP